VPADRSRVRAALALAAGAIVIAAAPVVCAVLPLRLVPYAGGFTAPVAFVQDPGDPLVQFVVEQGGRIRTVVSGAVQPVPFLDIRDRITSGGERGLLGLAFPPDAAASGRFYVNYTDLNGDTVIARFTRSADPRVADRTSGFALQWSTGERVIRQPFANHNGGWLAFGPDGDLYVGTGDGGSGNDPQNNAQNPASLLGKMLRVDVAVAAGHAAGFVVPASNPFVSNAGYRPEIWDIGLRNPWRFSFDSGGAGATGALLIGDVGQSRWEEVDYEPAGSGGRNYGWVVREGANPTAGVSGIAPSFLPMTDPIHQYDHGVGQSITGGYVYRGATMGAFRGRYFFADFISGHVYSTALTVDPVTRTAASSDVVDHTSAFEAAVRPANVSSFGVNAAGELFVVDYGRGAILRLEQARPSAPTGVRIIR
jgi:glucose/arabinose dehydrogenase